MIGSGAYGEAGLDSVENGKAKENALVKYRLYLCTYMHGYETLDEGTDNWLMD
jgi:hypothetical protein